MDAQATHLPVLSNTACVLASSSANVFSSCSAWIEPHGEQRKKSDACIAYGSGRQIAIWWCRNPVAYPTIKLLKGHAAQVTVVKPLQSPTFPVTDIGPSSSIVGYRFISGDEKGGVKVWVGSCSGSDNTQSVLELPGHQRSISCLASVEGSPSPDSLSSKESTFLIVSGASDGCLMVWKLVERYDEVGNVTAVVELIQTIEFGNKIAMDASLTQLPGQAEDFLLTLAQTDSQVALYSLSLPTLSLQRVCSLPGHTDWVRCLDVVIDPNNPQDVLLASGSQDGYIRLWRCTKACDTTSVVNGETKCGGTISTVNGSIVDDPFKALDELTQTLKDEGKIPIVSASRSDQNSRHLSHLKVEMKKYRIPLPSGRPAWNMTSEAVLFGHEGWVTNVHWAIGPDTDVQLISTSSDRSMILWKPSADHNGIWLNSERFGELTGSTNLGFFGAHHFWDPNNGQETVLASGWTGGWHRWSRYRSGSGQPVTPVLWQPQIAPTGHSQTITGVEWDSAGEYILTCSHDQTTRLWGPWRRKNNVSVQQMTPSTSQIESWHELGRPQVHGHDLFGLSFINDKRTQFVSISEEKVIRVFDTTEKFVRLASDLKAINVPFQTTLRKRYENATIPPLGLSNRVEEVAESDDPPKKVVEISTSLENSARCPPFEDELLTCTLWPETEKIYGHPSELSAIATSGSGKLLASACHATSAASASIRIHSTTSFRAVGEPLESHQLTVTQLAFNNNDSLLVSVSRDRGWSLWKPIKNLNNVNLEDNGFELLQKFEKAHARIIWDVSWGPNDSEIFVTGSRDKTVKVWSKNKESQLSNTWTLATTIKFEDSVRSCKFVPYLFNQQLILGVGLEDGGIHLYSAHPEHPHAWHLVGALDDHHTHTSAVERLTFCPNSSDPEKLRLASGGEDGVVRITDLYLKV
ncbi:hypothetical protein CROQUDRAFT_39802 [Cronartium quercuum f. sp. fusiforme G11]|uniref:Elongator complex protein 2 n=1 Tax=Cronartium quercuum f. sp. fusiforme G11 TaxID=708437 RepID=A0A9P6NNT4_9BASI|nr:hypothetical protein CROQUDRAFT_39802 [Cronartium quercuum f. sp. fusiforme G11]